MERISSHQFMITGAAVLMGTTFLPAASIVTNVAGRDSWMSILPGMAVGIPYGLMVILLMEQYPGQNLLQVTEILFGKWISKIIGILYISITGYFGGLLLAQVGNIYQSVIMPLVPIGMFYLGGLLIVFYLVSSGIEVFARFSEVIFPLIVVALILNIVLSIPRIEPGEALPILGEGIKPLFLGGFKAMPFAMEYILFAAGILTFLPTGKQELTQLKKGVWRAVLLVGFLNMLVVLIQMLVFGPLETIRLVYGLLVLGKMVEVSRTVAGVESLFLGAWLGALIIKISAFFFTVTWGLETVFKLKGLKWNLAVGAIFMGIAFRFEKGPSLVTEIGLVDDYLILPFASIWILALWGFSRWKKGAGI
ncbi:GerAB/ArcD/ProY family transporter [Desulfosporosinus youngiae]|uniref:Spore germination protein n=1 Tax=Desulfosporosinus youngiae DSM 17734 TaxID=768710 RepID=H5XRL6_9FIRM|nr:GerAB/ArcD/ProY family transporter [Desulfosporosinus youngiae]EHQ87275.1 Spore germination protein [Desulfosporosinus youngiae DSM 17734]